MQLFVLANKADSPEETRKVDKEEGEQFCKARNLGFYEVSAKTGEQVPEAFQAAAESLTKIYPKEDRKNTRNPVIDEISKKKK